MRERKTDRVTNARAASGGFTLLEVLLVVVIALLATGVAMPSFIRSYRGAKLRTSTRAVLMSHRYARAMAVLKQVDVAILYDTKKQEIEIVSVQTAGVENKDMFLDSRDDRTGIQTIDEDVQAVSEPGGVVSELIRPLAEGVKIDEFDSPNDLQQKDGLYWVNYYKNGMCEKYHVRLKDEYNKTSTVFVDPLSGKAKVEYD